MLQDSHQTCEPAATMSLTVNGQPFEIAASATIAALIAIRQPRPPFAVELNKHLVRRSLYGTTRLNSGDIVEIVTLVGGG